MYTESSNTAKKSTINRFGIKHCRKYTPIVVCFSLSCAIRAGITIKKLPTTHDQKRYIKKFLIISKTVSFYFSSVAFHARISSSVPFLISPTAWQFGHSLFHATLTVPHAVHMNLRISGFTINFSESSAGFSGMRPRFFSIPVPTLENMRV